MNYFSQTIYTADDLKRVWGSDGNTFKKRLSYQLRTKKLYKLRRGLYIVHDARYHLEQRDYLTLANKLYTPSYVSFETVLQQYGVVFQLYETVMIASLYTKSLQISISDDLDPVSIQSHRMPLELLVNPVGLLYKEGYVQATLERAVCDTLWRSPQYSLDRLDASMLDTEELLRIGAVYASRKPAFQGVLDRFLHNYGLSMAVTA